MLELLSDGSGHRTCTSTLTVNGQRTYRTGISSRCKVQAGGRRQSQLKINNKLFIDTVGAKKEHSWYTHLACILLFEIEDNA